MLIPIAVFYIPMRYAGSVALAMPDTGPSGIYARLADRGYGPVRFDEDIEVRGRPQWKSRSASHTAGRQDP
ncbi:hypothetical protein AB0H37_23485 [Actinomadura sp. NPDC023710]|uniref:hypothetical protein n=1 Tax=Actinomadura sp. NPDC023710 TaxID=3158219 RepID=UPI0033DCF046